MKLLLLAALLLAQYDFQDLGGGRYRMPDTWTFYHTVDFQWFWVKREPNPREGDNKTLVDWRITDRAATIFPTIEKAQADAAKYGFVAGKSVMGKPGAAHEFPYPPKTLTP